MTVSRSSRISLGEVSYRIADGVATVEIHKPPHNFLAPRLVSQIADAYGAIENDALARVIVLCSEGKNFCGGADFSNAEGNASIRPAATTGPHLYDEAIRLFDGSKPVVAAIQGAAVGGGLGLAMTADFRIGTPSSRFSANFARLGFHHGFGLTYTLPLVIGNQRALELLYTGRRISGDEALTMGLVDRLVTDGEERDAALGLASEVAASAPLAVQSIRRTMRRGSADAFKAATDWEKVEQLRLAATEDWVEGVRAMAERRVPEFRGL
jgi:2-(1,2-epoxy-1,2-dihydrophenyl)acetyl-CoA isomerase